MSTSRRPWSVGGSSVIILIIVIVPPTSTWCPLKDNPSGPIYEIVTTPRQPLYRTYKIQPQHRVAYCCCAHYGRYRIVKSYQPLQRAQAAFHPDHPADSIANLYKLVEHYTVIRVYDRQANHYLVITLGRLNLETVRHFCWSCRGLRSSAEDCAAVYVRQFTIWNIIIMEYSHAAVRITLMPEKKVCLGTWL